MRSASQPNVILVTIDTLRADHLGSYGDRDAATPALDALALHGTRFADATSHVPLTLPSHASILTGRTPPGHGVRNNPNFALRESVPTLAERFQAAGYETAAFVSGFPLTRRFGLARGFDLYDDRFPRGGSASTASYTERRADTTLAAVRAWFERRLQDGSKRPFFLWVHFFDPHRPYDPPEPYGGRFRDRPYDGEIAFVDEQIAALLALTGDPAFTRTLVAVTADHGEGLDEHDEPTHGLFIYRSTLRVPLIFIGPGVPAARVIEPPVSLIDIAPTLLDLARLRPIEGIEGHSIVPLLASRGSRLAPPPVYVESLFGRLCCGWAALYGWRDGPWMYIDAPEPELYDVGRDPEQRTNVAAAHPAEVARFQQAIRTAAQSSPIDDQSARPSGSTAKQLASIGYFSGSATVRPSERDPKRMAALAVRMENAIAREHVEPAAAAAELVAVVREDPSNPLARRHLAIALSAAHDYGAAIREIEELQRLGDTSSETVILLGECQRLDGRAADAVQTLKRAVARDERDNDAYDALGRALVAAGQHEAAVETFARALAIQPDDAEALGALGDLAIERGDFAAARQRLEALYARDPLDAGVAVKLGVVLARSADLTGAISLFRSVLVHAPANVDALVNLGAALAKSGASADAVPYFERAVAAGAASPVVLNGLAAAKLDVGDRMGAAAILRRSLAARPDQPNIRDLLRQAEADPAPTRRPSR